LAMFYFLCVGMFLLRLLVLCGLYLFLPAYFVSFVPLGLTFRAYLKKGSQIWTGSPAGRCKVMQLHLLKMLMFNSLLNKTIQNM
jgi:hypothetical protein